MIGVVVLVVVAIVYFTLVKPNQRDPKKILEQKIAEYMVLYGPEDQPEEQDDLPWNVYVRSLVIYEGLRDGLFQHSDLSQQSTSKIANYEAQIKGSANWLAQVEEQVPGKWSTLEESIYQNALWMAFSNGELTI